MCCSAPRRLASPLGLRLGGRQFSRDLCYQPFVARQAEQKIHPIGLAPRHQLLAGKTGICPQQDAGLWPARPDQPDDPRHFSTAPAEASMSAGRSFAASR